MRALHFLVIFSLIFNSPFSFAAETSSGGKSSATNRKPSSSSAAQSSVQLKKGQCPTAIKDSVLDDYKDKHTLWVFKYDSMAKTCNTAVTAYQDYMTGKGRQTQFKDPEALSAQLSKQFESTISPDIKQSLDGCNSSKDLTPEQAKIAQTRFYAAATRIEKFNKSALDEIAFIDSITEGSSVLDGVECTKLLPEVKSNCENLKNEGMKCRAQTNERFEEQVQKTMDNIGKIEALKEAEDRCKTAHLVKCAGATKDCPMRGGFTFTSQKSAGKKCENITMAIEILKDEIPWIRGDIFDKIARGPAKPRSSVRKYLSREKIKEGLREQLKGNRTALASAYKDNLQNMRCLIYETDDKGEKCDFNKIRTEITKLDLPVVPPAKDRTADMEVRTYFDAENCLIDINESRAQTKDITDSSARDAILTVVTMGLGSIAAGSKVLAGLSKTASMSARRGAFGGALGVDAFFAQGSSREAFKSCTAKSTAVLENLSLREKQKGMVCDNAKSPATIARETNSSCLVDGLLAGVDMLPFLGAAAPLFRMAKTSPASNATVPPVTPNASTAPAAQTPAGPLAQTPAKPEAPKDAPKPEVAAAEKPKPKPTPKPESKPVQKPSEAPAAPVAETKPETKPELKPEVKPEPAPVAKPADEVSPQAGSKVQAAADAASGNPAAPPAKPELIDTNNPKLSTSQSDFFGSINEVETARKADVLIDSGLTPGAKGPLAAAGQAGNAAGQALSRNSVPAYDPTKPTSIANMDLSVGRIDTHIDSNAVYQATKGQIVNLDQAGDAGRTTGKVTGIHQTPNGLEIEATYQKSDGSLGSRRLLAQEFFQTNPKIRDALDNHFYEFMSGGLKRDQTGQQLAAAPKKPVIPQTTNSSSSIDTSQKSAALDMRSSNSNSAMAVAAAPSAPAIQAPVMNQAVIAPRNTVVNLEPELQSLGNAAPAANVEQVLRRAPASQNYAVQSAKSAEEELVQALSQNNTRAVAPTVSFGKVNRPSNTGNLSFSSGSGNSNAGINLKADNRPTTYVDPTDNVRFIEGEQIKIANFEGGKDAEFKIVKKLENGLLRVSDENGKEFDLLRDEVKSAERLNVGATAATGSPSGFAATGSPGGKTVSDKIVENVKLKEEFVRQGDNITVKNFEGGADLNATVVRKNTDGTVRIKDEAGKEFDLVKSEVKDADFSRGLTAEVKQNLEIADETVRLKTAEDYLGRTLSDVQKQAVLKSHKIAEGKNVFALSKTDLRQKTKVLREAGLTEDEASLLLRKGVTGSAGLDNVKIVADQPAVPKFEIVKGQKIEVPMGKTGLTNPGAVRSGPDARGYYEVEFYQKGAGIGATRKTAAELTAANVKMPPKVENPIINVPAVGKDISYPGKVISGPNAKGQYEVEIYPPGKPATVVRMDGLELKKANTPEALRQAKIRDARRASFEKRSSAELEQIVNDSLRNADSRGVRDSYNVDYGSSGKPDRTLKAKKIDIEGQKALEELAKRQNKSVNELYEEIKQARKNQSPTQNPSVKVEASKSQADVFNSAQAGGARNELDYLAEQDGLKGSVLNQRQRENAARELGITDDNFIAAMDYNAVASRKETRELFEKLFPKGRNFDADLLRQSMSFNPRGGYIGAREFTNAEKFVEAVQKADLSGLTLSERRLLNKYTDRAPLYARQGNADVALLPRQSVEADSTSVRKIASIEEAPVAVLTSPAKKVLDPAQVAGDARNQLDYLAEQDRLKGSRLTERQRESVARELGIYDANKTSALDYASVASKKETRDLFEKLFPGQKDFDPEMLRQSMSFNPRGGYVGAREFVNAEKFVNAVQKADIDGSTLSLSERRLLNKFTDRAPLYARQVNPEAATITRQSLEAVVPPRITNNQVSAFAARSDEIVAQVKIKPEMVRAGDQVSVKNFEGGADLKASFVRKNVDGTIRVKDSSGKEFNLGAQATGEAQFHRGLTAELKVNGALDNPSRVKAAEEYVKRPLTAAQKEAVISSHNVGGEGRGFFDYTPKELKEKTEILRKAGFSNSEATLLIRKGVTGNNPSEVSNLIKVAPGEVRIGDDVVIREFNGTGELRGQITGPAKNGGLILREANGSETIIYKSDLEDLSNSQITRNPTTRSIASAEELSLERAPIKAPVAKNVVPVEPGQVRAGDKILLREFNGTGEFEGVVVGTKKNGGYLVREANGNEVILYKSDLEEPGNVKITREWGAKALPVKSEPAGSIEASPDSPLLVSKDKKNNPDIAVPLGNGELRQGRVLSQLELKPGFPKVYVVEYVDEVGVTSQIHLTQDELLAVNTPDALKKVKAASERSLQYQSKTDVELQQLLDEGNRAAKEAVGKGRPVDKPDLSAEAQSALSEIARRNQVTSNAVFEAYRRGGVKGLENLSTVQKILKSSPTVATVPVTPIISKPLSQLKTGDFVVTAGIGDRVKLPKPQGSTTEGVVIAREKINGEVTYTVALKQDGQIRSVKMTDRELGDANSSFVGVRVEPSRSSNPENIRSQIEEDFKKSYSEAELSNLRLKSSLKIESKNKVIYDNQHPLLKTSAGVAMPDGTIYINIDRDPDQRFSTLLHELSHTKTDVRQGDLTIRSLDNHLAVPGYQNKFSVDEIKASTINFAVDKQTVITQSKLGKPGLPNKSVRREIASMQTSVNRRQAFINVTNASLDQVDESLATLTMSKNAWGKNGEQNTIWHLRLKNVEGNSQAAVYLQFLTSVNTSRDEAMAQIREFSRQERIKLLNAQAKLDYDKAYLAELRVKVGVPKPAPPLNGPSLFKTAEAKSVLRNPASDGAKAQALSENKSTGRLIEDLDSVIGERGRAAGLRNTAELTSGHPLTPVIEKQRQIVNRLSKIDAELQPENFARVSVNVANDLLKSGDVDLAVPYYRLAADTIETNLGTTAKNFWSNEANTKAAIKAGFISDNSELAHMATQKSVLAKLKNNTPEEVKKVALDQFHNLGYEYDKILYGIKRYGNKNKELDLLVIRKQQQHIAKKYGLTKQIQDVIGADTFKKIDDQADLTVDDLLSNPKQIIDPDKFKKTQRIPASTGPSALATPPSAALPVQKVSDKPGVTKSTPELEAEVDRYEQALKANDLAPKEIKSVSHQHDLIAATRNPVVIKVMDKAGVDFEALKFGMLDSDVGKISKFQENLLLKETKESDELFDNLRGVAKSAASQELEAILKQQGFAHPHLLNPNLTNQDIREIIAEVPVLRGYLHELPGMQLAIRDLNAGNISKEQFRERFLANLGHNGPNEGYWSFLSDNLVPSSLAKAKNPKAKVLFENTIYQNEKLSNGVVTPVYPSPQSVEGVVHAVFDRLSQGTRGGVDKIFYELGGAPLASNPKAALRGIGVAPNTGLQLPHEMLVGNPEKTMRQLQALQQHAGKSPIFTKEQQTELSAFVGGAIARLEKQNRFIKENLVIVRDKKGALEKMTLKFQGKNLTITDDTPAEDVAKAMSKMLNHEENLHGEPFKEFVLSPANVKPVLASASNAAKLDQRHTQTSLDYLLVNIAKRSDNEKADAPEVVEFLKAYKNDPAFATWLKGKEISNAVHYDVKGHAAKLLNEFKSLDRKPAAVKDAVTVNLADQKLFEPSRLNEWQQERQINFKRSQYDNVLSSLKKGDVIQAPSSQSGKIESIELGDYIGAGNTSNLYAMNDPDKVIRLPYLTTGVSGQKTGKDFFQTYVQTREKYLGIPGLDVVKVFDHGKNFEYIVNERVPIKMTLNEVEEKLYYLKENKSPSVEQIKEISELQQVWDKFVKIAPEIAKRSNDQTRISSLQSAKAIDRDTALVQEARQVALTPDGRFVLLDWE